MEAGTGPLSPVPGRQVPNSSPCLVTLLCCLFPHRSTLGAGTNVHLRKPSTAIRLWGSSLHVRVKTALLSLCLADCGVIRFGLRTLLLRCLSGRWECLPDRVFSELQALGTFHLQILLSPKLHLRCSCWGIPWLIPLSFLGAACAVNIKSANCSFSW